MIYAKSVLAVATTLLASSSAIALEIVFEPADASFAKAAQEYEELWAKEGARIVEVMERLSGLEFESGPIMATVIERPSFSGYKDKPMRLRASYPPNTKRAALTHEIGHRLLSDIANKDFEDHPVLFLFLYDAWVELWGKEFADAEVIVESNRRGIYDYERAWQAALSLDPVERAATYQETKSRLELEKGH